MEHSQSISAETEPVPQEKQGLSLQARTARVRVRLEVPLGMRVRVELEAAAPDGKVIERKIVTLGAAKQSVIALHGWLQACGHALEAADQSVLARWLIWLSIGIYAAVRLVALPSFPIYFFTDEAIQTVSAADLLHNGLRNSGELLPTFFPNGSQYNLGLSVYFQVLPYLFFDKSVWVTRGTAALVTLLAAWSVSRILKDVFHSQMPWLGVLVLSLTPAWFLHSRTAFETTMAVSMYAAFLHLYLRYRTGSPRALYGAVFFGALAFYAYSPARIVMVVLALLLFFTDFGYHRKQWKVVVRGFGLALLLALPFARFLYNHPDATEWQMRLLGSVWVSDVPVDQKILATWNEYSRGLNPLYWYLPHIEDLSRHTMKGYGHLLRQFLPFGLAGILLAFWKARNPAYRTVFLAVLAAPAGAALVKLGVTRALFLVVPMALLTALAITALLEWLKARWKLSDGPLMLVVFIVLAAGNAFMLVDSLRNGPTWFREYALNGMQYGAQQLFGEIARDLEAAPDTRYIVSPSWANGTDVLARFFFDDPTPLELGSAAGYYAEGRPIPSKAVFVLTAEEYEALPRTRFSEVAVLKTLPYPDGQPGFYFLRLAYVEGIKAVIDEEREEKRKPKFATVLIDGVPVELAYTRLDIGEPSNIFDQNQDTLVRTEALNPLELDMHFPAARRASALLLHIGGTTTRIDATVWAEGREEPFAVIQSFDETSAPRTVRLELLPGLRINRARVKIYNASDTPEGHVHLWELTFTE